MAVSQLIAHMGVRVDPADVEEALRELPPGASVLDWYRQMTAKERARRSVVASVLMAVHARALHGDAWDPWCSPHGVQPVPGVTSVGLTLCHGAGGRRADYARRSACSGP